MPTSMSALLEEVSRDHFPYPPATLKQVEEFEQRMGWRLDPDLRAFYLHCNGAELLERRPDCPYRILPLSRIVRARVALRGEDSDEWGPASFYAICDVQDGNYILIDVSRQEHGRYPIHDGDHETWPDLEYCRQFAGSFSEFLEGVLRDRSPGYWLRG
jgi:hypothetical protein